MSYDRFSLRSVSAAGSPGERFVSHDDSARKSIGFRGLGGASGLTCLRAFPGAHAHFGRNPEIARKQLVQARIFRSPQRCPEQFAQIKFKVPPLQ